MKTSTDELRAALDRLVYWAEASAESLPDAVIVDELIDSIRAVRALLG